MRNSVCLLLSVLAAAALAACGVVRSTSAIVQAQQYYDRARLAGAESTAPYEYTMGVEFLRKAQEEAGYSDYQDAEKLALRAQELLAEATHLSEVTDSTEPAREAGAEE